MAETAAARSADPQVQLSIETRADPHKEWTLVSLEGGGSISDLYHYRLRIASRNPNLKFDDILAHPVTARVHYGDHCQPVHGVFSDFRLVEAGPVYVSYQATLVPRLWYLGLASHNRIFQDQTVREIAADVLKGGGLTAEEVDDRCKEDYPKLEFTMQVQESDLAFLDRLLQHNGIFYYWEQTEKRARLVLGDRPHAYGATPLRGAYVPPSGTAPVSDLGGATSVVAVVQALSAVQHVLPRSITLKDYNYRNPALDLVAQEAVDAKGHGLVTSYGDHFKDEKEAKRIAKVRAQELSAERLAFQGESDIPELAAGAVLEVEGHPRSDLNGKLLLVEVTHCAAQAVPQLTPPVDATYHNSFRAIRAQIVYRPLRRTPKPRIAGVMHAHVDSAGSGEYADMDDQGRYRVKLPLDQSNAPAGAASRWIRMAQPYAGADYGMCFPLHKGTEVLLTFIDGDPDRPIIVGAVPNAVTPGPVSGKNPKQCLIKGPSGAYLEMYNERGQERCKIGSPVGESFHQLGAPDAPCAGISSGTKLNRKDATGNDCIEEVGGLRVAKTVADYIFLTRGASETISSQGILMAAGTEFELAKDQIEKWVEGHGQHATHGTKPDGIAGEVAKVLSIKTLQHHALEVFETAASVLMAAAFGREKILSVEFAKSLLAELGMEQLAASIKMVANGPIKAISGAGITLGSLGGSALLFARTHLGLSANHGIKVTCPQGQIVVAGNKLVHLRSETKAELAGAETTHVGFTDSAGGHHLATVAGKKTDIRGTDEIALASKKIEATGSETLDLVSGDYRVHVEPNKGVILYKGKADELDKAKPQMRLNESVCRIELDANTTVEMEQGGRITIRCHDQKVLMDKSSIEISAGGQYVNVDAQGGVRLKGSRVIANRNLEVLE